MFVSKRMRRYVNKRKHKKRLKQRHAMVCDGCRTNLDKVRQRYQDPDFLWWRDHERNGGYEYWQQLYRSGARKFAKDATNSVIRARYRDLLNNLDMDDMDMLDEIQALAGADYEKMFDFFWTIW